MTIALNDEGVLDVTLLTLEEKQMLFQKFLEVISNNETNWYQEYGPLVGDEDMPAEEFMSKLESCSDDLIWTDFLVPPWSSYPISITEGLTVDVWGSALLPGRQYEEDRIQYVFISSKPWSGDGETVFRAAECKCPFCNDSDSSVFTGRSFASSESEDVCEICNGAGLWEFVT